MSYAAFALPSKKLVAWSPDLHTDPKVRREALMEAHDPSFRPLTFEIEARIRVEGGGARGALGFEAGAPSSFGLAEA